MALARTSRKSGKASTTNPVSFISKSKGVSGAHLKKATGLRAFLNNTGNLSLQQRRTLVRQARILLENHFVHLPLKEAMHGINPIQKLSLLEHKLGQCSNKTMGSEYGFHRQMLEIFTSLRDLHTNYLLPAPFCNHFAFMPFSVEEYFDGDKPKYITTHMVKGFTHRHFKTGVEITHWSGVPISRAIELAANIHAGSNEAARHARGIDGLTLRALQSTLPPDECWVIIGYIDLKGTRREFRQEWIVSPTLPSKTCQNPDKLSEAAAAQGLDIEADIKQQSRKLLFAPQVIDAEGTRKVVVEKKPASAGESLTSKLAGVFRARSVKTKHGVYGYIRIYTFNIQDPEIFVLEFIRLVSLLPKEGLIIDVRGNGGGHIYAAEGLLQTLTPYEIEPEPTQFINTPLNATLCDKHQNTPSGIDLGPWCKSIHDAITTGAIYSRAYPITTPEFANQWGQQYHGPVVLITDARCYSATDIFAAGFQDHDIGKIIGVDDNTGAGGANVWTHKLLQNMGKYGGADPTPYASLPARSGMRVSIRRTLRVGARAGTPVEDIGVTPDMTHVMTRDDLLKGNIDLIERAASELSKMPVRQLDVETIVTSSNVNISAATKGLERVDVYIDDRPMASESIGKTGSVEIEIDLPNDAELLAIAGYEDGIWVAARNYRVAEFCIKNGLPG